MGGRRLALDGELVPLLLRGLLLTVATVLVAGTGQAQAALLPGIALVIVIAFAAIPLPNPSARLLQAFAEAVVLGLVIGSIVDIGPLYVPLLLLPVFTIGQRGGLAVGAAGGGAAGLAWLLGILSSQADTSTVSRLSQTLLWTILLVVVGLLGGWVRRLTDENRTYSDTAYEQAFRLLAELQKISRELSLGLDPPTLARALLDEVAAVQPDGHRAVSLVTDEGRLAPLAGHVSDDPAEDAASVAAWRSRTEHHDERAAAHAFPVTMGERVVAVLSLRRSALSTTQVRDVRRMVAENGPRLAAALLFDDVRRLATVDERLRLAREIHDGIAQELASVGYLLDDVANRVPDDNAEDLRALRAHVRRVVSDLRLSIFDLRSGVDDSIGLGTALSEHVQRVGQQSDLVVHTVLDEFGERLPPGVEVELLRIAQEAVTNVRKHAQASNLWVDCTVEAPRAWVRIADDGIGLQPPGPQSMGLKGMRERARRIGGELTVREREQGGGTVVEVTVGDWDDETRAV
ncbi:sensor histidine kinase [Aquipuribacter sp. SD81]|uniref:sensor histidine kinase n=1 Tax=Aquipuribacter sp. SD81 TaxID=3127703 RepID=UPI0030175EE4